MPHKDKGVQQGEYSPCSSIFRLAASVSWCLVLLYHTIIPPVTCIGIPAVNFTLVCKSVAERHSSIIPCWLLIS